MITITETQAQAILSMMPTKLYSVNLVVVDDMEWLRQECYQELSSIALTFNCCFSQSSDEVTNQTDMNFQFATVLEAFEFMEEAIRERCDAAISFVEVVSGAD